MPPHYGFGGYDYNQSSYVNTYGASNNYTENTYGSMMDQTGLDSPRSVYQNYTQSASSFSQGMTNAASIKSELDSSTSDLILDTTYESSKSPGNNTPTVEYGAMNDMCQDTKANNKSDGTSKYLCGLDDMPKLDHKEAHVTSK